MNILFLSLGKFQTIEQRNIYTDLLRVFIANRHKVYIVSPIEQQSHGEQTVIKEANSEILRVKTGQITKTNVIEKGINTLLIDSRFLREIKKHYSDVKFDMILYPTPPITLVNTIQYIKRRDQARTYLMLKDIFPQNAVDIGMMQKNGLKGLLYRYFRNKEKKLYAISDRIGCMSQANVDYILKHNPEIDPAKVEICPNSIEPQDMSITAEQRAEIREKYGIPQDKKVFVYGGNLGKPQGIPFLIECLKSQENREDVFFLIVGDGTEFGKLETYFNEAKPSNMKLMKRLPKEDYDRMVGACDVGMIFLDHRFTIPNFPSRLLAYMQAGLPVLAATDSNTDIGKVITEGGFGWWCESDNPENFACCVDNVLESDIIIYGGKAFQYLVDNYHVKDCTTQILKCKD